MELARVGIAKSRHHAYRIFERKSEASTVGMCLEATGLDNGFSFNIDAWEVKTLRPVTTLRVKMYPFLRTRLLSVKEIAAS